MSFKFCKATLMTVTGIVTIVTLGCGGGGSSMPQTTQFPEDTSVDLPLPSGHGIAAGEYMIAAGASGEHGNVVFSCPASGSACVVSVGTDGTVTYDRTGGVPTVMAAHEMWDLPSGHGLSAGQYTVRPGASNEHGNVVLSCPLGGSACVVSVGADGTVTYDRTGGVPDVMAAEDVVLAFTLAPGTERRLSSGIFLVCPAGGAFCEVESLTRDEAGQFSAQIAADSSTPFYWHSSTGLFAGNLGPYDERLVMVVGSPETRRVTCVDSVPCDISGLRFNDDGVLIIFPDTQHVHVTNDETGFFLRYGESRTIRDSDSREVLVTCPDPNGCGVNEFYISERYTDHQGVEMVRHEYAFDNRWGEPTFALVQDQMADDDTMPGDDDTMAGDDDTMAGDDDTMAGGDGTMELVHFPVTHWELADQLFWRGDQLLRDEEEVVCPGRGRRHHICIVEGKEFSIVHLLEQVEGKIIGSADRREGFTFFRTDTTPGSAEIFAYGWWGKHSAFGEMIIPIAPTGDGFYELSGHYFAFGHLYKGKPTATQGSGIWRGLWLGIGGPLDVPGAGSILNGKSELEYDFETDTLDLTLTVIDVPNPAPSVLPPYSGPRVIKWHREEGQSQLTQNSDGSFFIPNHGNDKKGTSLHPDWGYVDGDFYGSNAEEFAGVFERHMDNYFLHGAFGGRRQE